MVTVLLLFALTDFLDQIDRQEYS